MSADGGPSARAVVSPPESPLLTAAPAPPEGDEAQPGWERLPQGWDVPPAAAATLPADDVAALSAAAVALPSEGWAEAAPLDAILVICGGVTAEGALQPWVALRCAIAAALFRAQRAAHGVDVPVLALGGGTYHRPPFVNEQGFSVHESSVMTEALLQMGVPQASLTREWSSYDTLAQAFFARVNHSDHLGWRRLAVVCSAYNLRRVKFVFERVFALTRGVDAPQPPYELAFYGGSGSAPADDASIAKRERASAVALKYALDGIRTLASFHEWFYTQHKAYSVAHHSAAGVEYDQ